MLEDRQQYLFIPLDMRGKRLYVLFTLIILYFVNGQLPWTNSLRKYWTDLHKIFRICSRIGGADSPTFILFCDRSRNAVMATNRQN